MRMPVVVLAGLFVSSVAMAQPGGGMPPGGSMPDPTEMFMKKLDQNGDGKVDLAEFRAPGDDMFKQMDSSGDGMIDKAETAAYHAQMMKKMEEMRKRYGNRPPQGQGAPRGPYPR